MINRIFIFLFLANPFFSIGQLKPIYLPKYFDKNYDCKYISEISGTKTVLDGQMSFIRCLANYRGDLSKAVFMLDSLYAIYKNDDLLSDKALYLAFFKPHDTTYLSIQRQLLEKKYRLDYSHAQLGIYYMNFVAISSKDSAKIKLSVSDKIKLLGISEDYLKKSLSFSNDSIDFKSYTLMYLSNVCKEIYRLKNIKVQKLSTLNKFDTLTLMTDIPDCGEFGGHIEYIKFFHKDNGIVATFSSDSIICQTGFREGKTINIPINLKGKLNDLKLLQKHFAYLESLNGGGSNAPICYWVFVDKVLYSYTDWHGSKNSKDEYETFKKMLFK